MASHPGADPQRPAATGPSVWRTAAPALVLAALVLAPFWQKAFTIDDTLFLQQAQQLLVDPWHPTTFDMVWSDRPLRMSAIMPSGPVMAYLLVPSVRFGGAEWIAHLIQFALFGLGIVSTVAVSLRLGLGTRGSMWAGLLLAATPTTLAMATTAMPDIPAMAFGVLGLERFLAWRADRRLSQALVAVVALALATLARSHAGLLLGVAGVALFAIPTGRPPLGDDAHWRRAWPLAGALVAILAILLVTGDPAGPSVAGSMRGFATLHRMRSNVFAFFVHLALCLPLAAPWAILRMREVPWRLFAVALPAAVLLFFSTHAFANWSWALHPPIVIAATLSATVLVDIARDAWQRHDAVQGLLFAWVLLALPVAVYIHLPSKYLTVSAPAIAILIARQTGHVARPRWAFLAVVVAIGAALGGLIARADANFAGLDREAVATWVAPAVHDGRRVWASGHWGFQWYAERAGARAVTATPPLPQPGDWVIVSGRAGGSVDQFPHRRLIASIGDSRPGGRVMSAGAGFYSNTWGFLPWTWGTDELERVDLWEIEGPTPTAPSAAGAATR